MPNCVAATACNKPLVAVVTDRENRDGVEQEIVRTRYLDALREKASVIPLLLPSNFSPKEVETALLRLNGILLTGAGSNVASSLYGKMAAADDFDDTARDATTMAAIRTALAHGIPLLGICRGLQELNVALGGTLTQDISDGVGRLCHTEDLSLPRDRQYDPIHELKIQGNGIIAECLNRVVDHPVSVNSLHAQGIDRLSEKLAVDAISVDGVVEAVSVKSASTFAAAVQWHPEWFHSSDHASSNIFQAFGDACRLHKESFWD